MGILKTFPKSDFLQITSERLLFIVDILDGSRKKSPRKKALQALNLTLPLT